MTTEQATEAMQASVTDSWKSAIWWISGTVMWVMVFVSMYLMSGQSQAVTNEVSPESGMIVQPTAGGIIVKPALAPGMEKIPATIREFSLTDRRNKTVTQNDLKGKPWVCNFIFTRCLESCPMITGKMRGLTEELKDVPVNFVSFTIDPAHDTTQVLQTYAEVHRADIDQWYFLTGERELIYDIIQKNFLSVVEEKIDAPKGYEFAHSNRFFHIDAEGNIVGSYDGMRDADLNVLKRVLLNSIPTPEVHQFFHVRKKLGSEEETQGHGEIGGQTVKAELKPDKKLAPAWVTKLPLVNTSLNALAGVLLVIGLLLIKIRQPELHKKIMLTAFGVSVAFLMCYLTYHFSLHYFTGEGSRKYTGTGMMRTVYFVILISHVILAVLVPFLAIVTIHKGIRKNWVSHHKWAKVTFPIWLYVSITGVVVYVMLYQV